jgi:hypothetical protein
MTRRDMRVHIGLMTHSHRPLSLLEDGFDFWIRDFIASKYNGGGHFVSEQPVMIPDVDTAIANFTRPTPLGVAQAHKRVRSLEYYLANSTANFYIFAADDAFVWTKNLKYLFGEVDRQRLTGGSHFVWGNCLVNRFGTFIQGGAGYFMSRYSAAELLRAAPRWLPTVGGLENVVFMRLLAMTGLSAKSAASQYIMGQYIQLDQAALMANLTFDRIMTCPEKPPPDKECRPFFERFNRVAIFHRLSHLRVRSRPRPIYDYQDNLYWYQNGEYSAVCFKRE